MRSVLLLIATARAALRGTACSKGSCREMSPEDEDVEIVPVCTGLRGYASARGCIEIHGDLVIDDAPEDVQLPFLEKITGSLYVGTRPVLGTRHSLHAQTCHGRNKNIERVALDALVEVEGQLRVRCTDRLAEMSFAALETVGVDFKIEYNAALDVLDAASFPYLRETGATVGAEGFNEFAVADNAELREIRDAFPRLQKVAQTLRIMYNPDLTTFSADAFSSLTKVGSLQLTDLKSLVAVPANAFPSLVDVTHNAFGPSDLWIGHAESLQAIEPGAFPKLERVDGHIWMLFMIELSMAAGSFPRLSTVEGFVHIHACDSLPSLDGLFAALETAGGVQISDSSAITSVGGGFNALREVTGHIGIFGLTSLEEVRGFGGGLTHVGDLDIYSNPHLREIDAFHNLEVASQVRVFGNPELQKLGGFHFLKRLTNRLQGLADKGQEAALVVYHNNDHVIIDAFENLESSGTIAIQRTDTPPAFCGSPHVVGLKNACFCTEAPPDSCFEHPEVEHTLEGYMEEYLGVTDDDDFTEELASAPKMSAPGKLGFL